MGAASLYVVICFALGVAFGTALGEKPFVRISLQRRQCECLHAARPPATGLRATPASATRTRRATAHAAAGGAERCEHEASRL